MNKRHLLEAASLADTEPRSDGSWAVRLISEGRGSSGVYTRELLENYYHVFEDVLSFLNHPSGDVQDRNFTEIAGRIKNVRFVTEDSGLGAIYGDYFPDDQYLEKLSKYRDKLGLSIYASGTGYVEESSGDFIVETFEENDPFRSVDVVIAPGARGKFMENMRKVYSVRTEENSTVTVAVTERNKDMEKEILEALKGVKEALDSLVAEKVQKEAEATQVEADAEAIKTAVESYDAAVKMVNEAELFEAQKAEILAVAKEGKDISALVESAKAVKEEALKAAQGSNTHEETHGVVLNGRKVESATELGKVFG